MNIRSDRRIKSSIQPIIYSSQVSNFVDRLNPVGFFYNYGVQKQVGMVAQDVLTACGGSQLLKSCIGKLDTYDEADPNCPLLTIKYESVIPLLVLEIQNSKQMIKAMEEKIEDLEKRVWTLEHDPYP